MVSWRRGFRSLARRRGGATSWSCRARNAASGRKTKPGAINASGHGGRPDDVADGSLRARRVTPLAAPYRSRSAARAGPCAGTPAPSEPRRARIRAYCFSQQRLLELTALPGAPSRGIVLDGCFEALSRVPHHVAHHDDVIDTIVIDLDGPMPESIGEIRFRLVGVVTDPAWTCYRVASVPNCDVDWISISQPAPGASRVRTSIDYDALRGWRACYGSTEPSSAWPLVEARDSCGNRALVEHPLWHAEGRWPANCAEP